MDEINVPAAPGRVVSVPVLKLVSVSHMIPTYDNGVLLETVPPPVAVVAVILVTGVVTTLAEKKPVGAGLSFFLQEKRKQEKRKQAAPITRQEKAFFIEGFYGSKIENFLGCFG
jgi:hypothetical protein